MGRHDVHDASPRLGPRGARRGRSGAPAAASASSRCSTAGRRRNTSNSPLFGGDVEALVADEERPGYVWIVSRFGVQHTDGDDWTSYPRTLLGLTQNTTSQLIYAGAPAPDGTLWIGTGLGVFHFDPATGAYTLYDKSNTALPSNDVWEIEIAPDGSVWIATFDDVWPYPGGLTHFDGATWTTYTAGASPLPHNQIQDLASRRIPGGYEVWVATASEGAAVVTVTAAPRAAAPRRR